MKTVKFHIAPKSAVSAKIRDSDEKMGKREISVIGTGKRGDRKQ